jgi:hypothetical protein
MELKGQNVVDTGFIFVCSVPDFTFMFVTLRCDIPVALVKSQNIQQTLEVKTQPYCIIDDGNS